jgi:hypothetical protein
MIPFWRFNINSNSKSKKQEMICKPISTHSPKIPTPNYSKRTKKSQNLTKISMRRVKIEMRNSNKGREIQKKN